MADRFPSLDEIDAGQTEARGNGPNFDLVGDSTDADDFLSRERAALGDDADQFVSASDNNINATVEDAGDDDLLGGGGGGDYSMDGAGNEDITGFESSFPAVDTSNEVSIEDIVLFQGRKPARQNQVTHEDKHMAPGGTITGTTLPYLPGAPVSSSYDRPASPEPDVIREWRERRDLAIQHRDEVSAERKAKTVKEGQQAIDDFYENYNNKKEKGIAQTRREAEEFLASRDDTTAGGTSWERIAKLVDLTGKGSKGGAGGSGKERFRELLISLRKDEKAPGATGY